MKRGKSGYLFFSATHKKNPLAGRRGDYLLLVRSYSYCFTNFTTVVIPLSVVPLKVYIPPARCPSWSWISFCPCNNDLSKLITTLPCMSVTFHLTFALLVLTTLNREEVST